MTGWINAGILVSRVTWRVPFWKHDICLDAYVANEWTKSSEADSHVRCWARRFYWD